MNNAVNNTGTIESIEGTLILAGPLQNAAGGILAVDSGSKLLVSSGLAANLGTINLTGGVFDNNSFALSNSAVISGYGTFRSGGLANYSAVIFTGAASTVNGPVTNAGDIDLGGTSTMVVNNGGGALLQTSGTLEMGTGATLSAGSVEINGGILTADGPAALTSGQGVLFQFFDEHLSGCSRRRRQFAHRQQRVRGSCLERQRQFLYRRHVCHGGGFGRQQPRRNRKRHVFGRRQRPHRVRRGRARRERRAAFRARARAGHDGGNVAAGAAIATPVSE